MLAAHGGRIEHIVWNYVQLFGQLRDAVKSYTWFRMNETLSVFTFCATLYITKTIVAITVRLKLVQSSVIIGQCVLEISHCLSENDIES